MSRDLFMRNTGAKKEHKIDMPATGKPVEKIPAFPVLSFLIRRGNFAFENFPL
jgi:hypothetical protein